MGYLQIFEFEHLAGLHIWTLHSQHLHDLRTIADQSVD